MSGATPSQAQIPALPFTIGSRASSRSSFTIPNIALGTSVVTPPGTPVQIPAVGFLKSISLEISAVVTGGTPTLQADAPWNIIDHVTFKNSAGQNIIAPVTGYELYLINKYAGQAQGLVTPYGVLNDPRGGRQYAGGPTGTIHFFLDIPLEFDASSGLGSIPALASNRSYQLELALAPIATVFGGTIPTGVAVTIDATANYWDVPAAQTPGGTVQQTEPFGLGTLSLWQKEVPVLAPGEQYTRSNNTGNVIRELILVLRNSSGVRTDADWTTLLELNIDNNPMLRLKKTEWQELMTSAFGYSGASLDAAGGLDTGVFVIPFHLLAGGTLGDPGASRAQYLATLDATLLQLHGYSWGAAASNLTILTNAVSSDNSAFIYSK
jgi:hypothetical protein